MHPLVYDSSLKEGKKLAVNAVSSCSSSGKGSMNILKKKMPKLNFGMCVASYRNIKYAPEMPEFSGLHGKPIFNHKSQVSNNEW